MKFRAGVLGALGFAGLLLAQEDPNADNEYLWFKVFADVYYIAKNYYVEPVPAKELLINAAKGMVERLDPYSEFFTTEELKEFQEDTYGEFGGIGIEISIERGRPVVVAPIEGTPAYRAGLRAGDVILEIDGEDTYGMSITEVVKKIRGEPGTKVRLTVYRPDEDKTFTVEIERAIIHVTPVKWTVIEPEKIGYVKLVQFQPDAAQKLREALAEILKTPGLKGIILDLRNDPGGLLDQAVKVADLFLPADKVVVSVKGRIENEVYKTEEPPFVPESVKLVILVNRGTASASEIVSGALQDYGRALLVGERTFGKFRVQNLIPVKGGKYGAVKITTAFYYTPKGRMLDEKGLTPDYEVKMTPEEWETLYEALRQKRIETNAGYTQLVFDRSLDKQLDAAIKVLLGTYEPEEEETNLKTDVGKE
ncbi:MAG: S41 family peptidase [Aquificae bacterium]|nr:S41 family peptidase [Aquificota bacterium]